MFLEFIQSCLKRNKFAQAPVWWKIRSEERSIRFFFDFIHKIRTILRALCALMQFWNSVGLTGLNLLKFRLNTSSPLPKYAGGFNHLSPTFKGKTERKPTDVNHDLYSKILYQASNYMFKVNNRKNGTRCEISSKLNYKDTSTTSFWCLYC